MFACIYYHDSAGDVALRDFAYTFSPLVEATAPGTVVLDIAGCELLFGSAYQLENQIAARAQKPGSLGGLGGEVNVAVAANPDTAIHAARYFQGVTFIAAGEELTGLGELPLDRLDHSLVSVAEKRAAEILETLRLWGLRTFAEFAALPIAGLSERMGQEGVRLHQLAAGKTERHLKLVQSAPVFTSAMVLEYPIAELEPLAFILARLLNQLTASLHAYSLATNELRLSLTLGNGSVHERKLNLPYPMRDPKVFLKLLLLDTELHPPPAAINAIAVAFEPVRPRLLQNGLFIPLAPEPEKLELTLSRLAKLVGPGNVGSPQLVDTHRPDAFLLQRFVLRGNKQKARGRKVARVFDKGLRSKQTTGLQPVAAPLLAFRVFRPALRAIVTTERGYPVQVSAWGPSRSVYGKIVQLAGPWRTTGDWWRADRWARDEWDVAVENSRGQFSNKRLPQPGPATPHVSPQVLYRIYRELHGGAWFVEGVYD